MPVNSARMLEELRVCIAKAFDNYSGITGISALLLLLLLLSWADDCDDGRMGVEKWHRGGIQIMHEIE